MGRLSGLIKNKRGARAPLQKQLLQLHTHFDPTAECQKEKGCRWSRQISSRHQGLHYHHITLHYTSTPPTATCAAASLPPVKRQILTPSIGLSQQRAVVFVQRVQERERMSEGGLKGGVNRRGKMEDGREKHRLCSVFCVWETAGKKWLNETFDWFKPTKQYCVF